MAHGGRDASRLPEHKGHKPMSAEAAYIDSLPRKDEEGLFVVGRRKDEGLF